MNKPAWLDDTAEIIDLLNRFLDRLDKQAATDRQQSVGITLNEKTLPALFNLGEEADQLWDLIKSLKEDHHLLHIKLKKHKDPFTPEYTQARLTLQSGGEDTLRAWLQRPAGPSPLQRWRNCVSENQHRFPGNTEKLSSCRIAVNSKDDQAVIDAFSCLAKYQQSSLSLRQLSSRCCWGDSKFLDNREELICDLFPDLQITTRPVMVNIFIPETVEGVLFIENQDSYTSAISGLLANCQNLILVYVAGFKGSAARIRKEDGASLHYHADSNKEIQTQLEDWWFERRTSLWPLWFWGDLDFSGMAILKALKQRFTEIQAWPPGYQALIQLLQNQQGHEPDLASKQAQLDPVLSGCEYADNVLLPAIRQAQAFIDQEAWTVKEADQ